MIIINEYSLKMHTLLHYNKLLKVQNFCLSTFIVGYHMQPLFILKKSYFFMSIQRGTTHEQFICTLFNEEWKYSKWLMYV